MNNLEKILAEINFHINPKLIKPDLRERVNTRISDQKLLKSYYERLMAIQFAFKKIKRYQVFFQKLYPIDEVDIQFSEALEHHIHAYLEDLDRLKEKIGHLLNVLKKDIKKRAINKEEIENALSTLHKNVEKVFFEATEVRRSHHHHGVMFVDSDIVDAKEMELFLREDLPLKNRLRPGAEVEILARKNKAFEAAKSKWMKIAEGNDEQISGLIDHVIDLNLDFIRQLLEINSLFDLPAPDEEVK